MAVGLGLVNDYQQEVRLTPQEKIDFQNAKQTLLNYINWDGSSNFAYGKTLANVDRPDFLESNRNDTVTRQLATLAYNHSQMAVLAYNEFVMNDAEKIIGVVTSGAPKGEMGEILLRK